MAPDDPRHGTSAGAVAHHKTGTPMCDPCGQAQFVAMKVTRVRLERGIRHRIPLGVKAHRIVMGTPPKILSEATGLHAVRCSEMRAGDEQQIVLRSTRDVILNADLPYSTVGIQRRLRALAAIGWPTIEIARHMGCFPTRLNDIRRGPIKFVREPFASRIVAAYEELHRTRGAFPGSSVKARDLAVRQGWGTPAAWDDIDWDLEHSGADVAEVIDDVAIERALHGVDGLALTHPERTEALRRHLAAGGSKTSFQKITGIRADRHMSEIAA